MPGPRVQPRPITALILDVDGIPVAVPAIESERVMTFPSVEDVAGTLSAFREYLSRVGYGETDVRLNVREDGHCTFAWGDPSYDTDHRGYWGASCVSPADTDEELRDTAEDLLEQVRDHHAQGE